MNFFQKILISVFRNLLEFPCPGCSAPTPENDNSLCSACLVKLRSISAPRCRSCGGVNDGILLQCSECTEAAERPWDDATSIFVYDSLVRTLILKFKFGNAPELAGIFAKFAAKEILQSNCKIDCIVPIPLHFFRYIRRGYNQCSLIAAEVSKITGIPVAHVLRRATTGHQSRRSRKQRFKAMNKAFVLKKRVNIENMRVLIIDDIFTTGATLVSAAKAIQTARPSRISVLTLARRE